MIVLRTLGIFSCLLQLLGSLKGGRRATLPKRLFPSGVPPAEVWVHALSVGEAQTAGVLLRRLLSELPGVRPLLSVSTPSGIRFAEKRLPFVPVVPSPLDCPFSLRRFLAQVNPSVFVLIETDLWPRVLVELKKRSVVPLLFNASISEASFKRSCRVKGFVRRLYSEFEVITAASPRDKARLEELLGREVLYLGNVKYDFEVPGEEELKGLEEELGGFLRRPRVVAGSTHEGEELALLEAFSGLEGSLVLCPRHPERAAEVARVAEKMGFRVSFRSAPKESDVLVVDTLGELRRLYGLADVAFVGGTLVPIGGHNLLEPAALKKPVVFGRFVESVSDVAEELLSVGGGVLVESREGLKEALLFAIESSERLGTKAYRVYESHRGAAERHIHLMKPFLKTRR